MAKRRWTLCFRLARESSWLLKRFDVDFKVHTVGHSGPIYLTLSNKFWYHRKPTITDEAVRNWPIDLFDGGGDLTTVEAATALVIFCLSALAYRGIHASAWTDFFPTNTEQLLWHISCGYLAAPGLSFVGGALLLPSDAHSSRRLRRS